MRLRSGGIESDQNGAKSIVAAIPTEPVLQVQVGRPDGRGGQDIPNIGDALDFRKRQCAANKDRGLRGGALYPVVVNHEIVTDDLYPLGPFQGFQMLFISNFFTDYDIANQPREAGFTGVSEVVVVENGTDEAPGKNIGYPFIAILSEAAESSFLEFFLVMVHRFDVRFANPPHVQDSPGISQRIFYLPYQSFHILRPTVSIHSHLKYMYDGFCGVARIFMDFNVVMVACRHI
jgi:hypothetical protein